MKILTKLISSILLIAGMAFAGDPILIGPGVYSINGISGDVILNGSTGIEIQTNDTITLSLNISDIISGLFEITNRPVFTNYIFKNGIELSGIREMAYPYMITNFCGITKSFGSPGVTVAISSTGNVGLETPGAEFLLGNFSGKKHARSSVDIEAPGFTLKNITLTNWIDIFDLAEDYNFTYLTMDGQTIANWGELKQYLPTNAFTEAEYDDQEEAIMVYGPSIYFEGSGGSQYHFGGVIAANYGIETDYILLNNMEPFVTNWNQVIQFGRKIVDSSTYEVTPMDSFIWVDAETIGSSTINLSKFTNNFHTIIIRRIGNNNYGATTISYWDKTSYATTNLTTDGQIITMDWIKAKNKWYFQ